MIKKNHEIIDLIKDIFSDTNELDKFFKFVEHNNDKEKAESIKKDMNILLSHNI